MGTIELDVFFWLTSMALLVACGFAIGSKYESGARELRLRKYRRNGGET